MRRKFISRRHIRIPIDCFVEYIGDGFIGTAVSQDFSVDGWHITAIESRPIQVGMRFALRVTLPTQPIPIQFEGATVQWVRGREFGVHMVRTSSEGKVIQDFIHSDRPSSESLVQARPSASQPTEAPAQEEGNQESGSKNRGQGGVGGDQK